MEGQSRTERYETPIQRSEYPFLTSPWAENGAGKNTSVFAGKSSERNHAGWLEMGIGACLPTKFLISTLCFSFRFLR